jgi:ribosomal protein S18 acetylase RimI-like enzyme
MTASKTKLTTRPLTETDFDTVVKIDSKITGRERPGFFQKRLQAALEEPKHFLYIGCELDGVLKGFLMGRLLQGEYGLNKPFAVIDVLDVDPESQGSGLGRALSQAFGEILESKKIDEVRSQADWRNHSILRFFEKTGFKLSARHILEREVSYMPTNTMDESEYDDAELNEIDFSDEEGDQLGALARDPVFCRSLRADDLDTLIRIDRKIGNTDRSAYYERKVKEAMDETGIRVSLVAEIKGMVVGFVMARVDYGEFDRTEPIAVLDTIGVDPGFAHLHVGRALLAQLLGNLATLRLEKVRTEVGAEQIDLTAFLISNDFHPAQHLTFNCNEFRC